MIDRGGQLGLLLTHAAATWAMVGVIWFVQLVHYPLFRLADPDRFVEFAQAYQRQTGWVVMPLMLAELATSIALVVVSAGTGRTLAWVGLATLALIWAATFFVQVPLHARLAAGYDAATIERLVSGNWIRTIAWTARGGLALGLLALR